MKRIESKELFWHNSVIQSVTEEESGTLEYRVDYPVDWDRNAFEMRTIRFCGTSNHSIDEIPFEGSVTILEVVELPSEKLELHLKTNAGNRFTTCDHIESDAEA